MPARIYMLTERSMGSISYNSQRKCCFMPGAKGYWSQGNYGSFGYLCNVSSSFIFTDPLLT